MVATVIVGMLCVHLLCFAVMFWLISTRLQGNRLGMDVFALGNAMLGIAYVLQLLGGSPAWDMPSVFNHTLTVCVPLVYWIGAARFFGRTVPLLKPLAASALAYTLAQVLVQALWGSVPRYAMVSLVSALIFLAMTAAALQGMRTFAKNIRGEMVLFVLLIGGLCVLNAIKSVLVARDGLEALGMGHRFQMVFYIYMSFLATVLAPSVIWLVLRRLTEELRAIAARDPLTQLLNRRGLVAGLEGHFRSRSAGPARLLMMDIDHFKRINDTFGHQAGDVVLCHIADVLRRTLRRGDLACRTGGEEFVIVCFEASDEGIIRLAERVRTAVEEHVVPLPGEKTSRRCTVTIGVSLDFHSSDGLDGAWQEADAALYRGKAGGRNRVEWGTRQGGQAGPHFTRPAQQLHAT